MKIQPPDRLRQVGGVLQLQNDRPMQNVVYLDFGIPDSVRLENGS